MSQDDSFNMLQIQYWSPLLKFMALTLLVVTKDPQAMVHKTVRLSRSVRFRYPSPWA